MLSDLRVRNLGVIEDVVLEFDPGMNALSGETGAGKTLVVEALELVLGGRASTSVVRSGSAEAMIEAHFVLDLDSNEEREVVLARAIAAGGRSRAWIDGNMVPVAALAELGATLLELHGQHEHQSLFSGRAQRRVLDAYGSIDDGEVVRLRTRLRELATEADALGGSEDERRHERELLEYQVNEITTAAISSGEDERVADEISRLSGVGAHRELVANALERLEGADSSILESLGEVQRLITSVANAAVIERLHLGIDALNEVGQELRNQLEGVDDDPERLDAALARQRQLRDLARKYGGDLEAVLATWARAEDRLAAMVDQDRRAQVINAEIQALTTELASAQGALREERVRAAEPLSKGVTALLHDLAMPRARFVVEVGSDPAGDDVRFLLGANEGEGLDALSKVASGGELSRTMLALHLLASAGPPSMVFDEVDAGVGGEAAGALGEALGRLGEVRQVIVVTHLPQVAARAGRHFAVTKAVREGRTATEVVPLSHEDRVVELSRMLSGSPDSATARAHAAELLAAGKI